LVSEMKQAVKDKNVEKINEIEGTINNVWNEISQRIYANKGQQQATQQPSDEEVAEQPNDVQDAEFEEVKN